MKVVAPLCDWNWFADPLCSPAETTHDSCCKTNLRRSGTMMPWWTGNAGRKETISSTSTPWMMVRYRCSDQGVLFRSGNELPCERRPEFATTRRVCTEKLPGLLGAYYYVPLRAAAPRNQKDGPEVLCFQKIPIQVMVRGAPCAPAF